MFGSILSSSAGLVEVLDAVVGDDSARGLGEIAGPKDGKAGEFLLTTIALNAGRVPEDRVDGRVEGGGGGGGGGGTGIELDFCSSGHEFAEAEPAAFPYNDPAEEMGAPKVGLEGLKAGGGAFFSAAISTFPTGV